MGSVEESDIVRQAEAILASAKSFEGDRTKRYELMKQLDLLHSELEDPGAAMIKQWSSVSYLLHYQIRRRRCFGSGSTGMEPKLI